MCLSTRGGGGAIPACIASGIPACLAMAGICSQVGYLVQGVPTPVGVCSQGGGAWWGAGGAWSRGGAWSGQTPPGETATAADGTHPTGMHSCFNCTAS